jgi:glycosyltransferase involved in cell wall biosynthesis
LLVPPRDPNALADSILALLGDSVQRARMGMAGRQRVEDYFTFDAQAYAYTRLVRRMLGAQPQSAPAEVART